VTTLKEGTEYRRLKGIYVPVRTHGYLSVS